MGDNLTAGLSALWRPAICPPAHHPNIRFRSCAKQRTCLNYALPATRLVREKRQQTRFQAARAVA